MKCEKCKADITNCGFVIGGMHVCCNCIDDRYKEVEGER